MRALAQQTDWAQKYRPAALPELILPKSLQLRLTNLSGGLQGMSLLFYGPPGTGKTSTACVINPEGTYLVDCSIDSSVATVRDLVEGCCAGSLFTARRTIVLDEVDSLTRAAQAALKGAIEKLSRYNDFIAVTNSRAAVSVALQSRLYPVSFDHAPDQEVIRRVEARLTRILAEEGRQSLVPSVLKAIVRRFFPDIRAMLKHLQFEVLPA